MCNLVPQEHYQPQTNVQDLTWNLRNTQPAYEGNYNDVFLNKLREHRSANAIIFGLEETQGVTSIEQHFIDEQEITTVLQYIDDEDASLDRRVVEVTRLGRKIENKVRPVKVRFTSSYYRDMAVRNGFKIKYIDSHLDKTKISKDLIREDREKAKMEYERKKQLKQMANSGNGIRPVDNTEEQETPTDANRQGVSAGAQAVPRQEEQQYVP